MKILHTSDWHLGDRLGRIERRPHIKKSLYQIARYLEEYQVEVMIVSGDIFSDRLRAEQRRDAMDDFKEVFSPFLYRGGSIVAISGNHDNEVFFETLRTTISMLPTGVKKPDGSYSGGFYISSRPDLVRLIDKEEQVVQFVLMPYPRASIYLRDEKLNYTNLAEKNRNLQEAYTLVLSSIQEMLERSQPSVLVSHVHVRGAQVHNLFHLTENEDVVFEPSQIPSHFSYAAYGHIHKSQRAIPGADHVRYAGSIERLDLGEKEDQKSVVYLEIKNGRRVDVPKLLSLECSPIYQLDITDPEQIDHLPDIYPDHNEALISYNLHYHPTTHNRDVLMHRIEEIFPNWYKRDIIQFGLDIGNSPLTNFDFSQPWKEIVRNYLNEELKKQSDQSLGEEIRELANRLMEENEVQA
ncbi:MAG: exonuclease subunit SbcD [Chloroflexi bacterium]|uniref:Nuclease SbcCD subunit D n=1 Tax=Candidatus Chlorohelix allophototropha TaxID=3003348 RepID=A0A8T7M4V6_9CHLR|nr:exonuclease subunit SbcD [Chloroflexota bacterium]WJW70355.1 exonuclease subunit SbcD [Chloroflexota bacterium L227-S17]